MNTLSWKLPSRVSRFCLLIVALLLPSLASAGVFYNMPASPVTGVTYSVHWYGTVSMTIGHHAQVQIKESGAGTWTTVGSGVSGHYGSCVIPASLYFSSPGSWDVRVVNVTTGSTVEFLVVSVSP